MGLPSIEDVLDRAAVTMDSCPVFDRKFRSARIFVVKHLLSLLHNLVFMQDELDMQLIVIRACLCTVAKMTPGQRGGIFNCMRLLTRATLDTSARASSHASSTLLTPLLELSLSLPSAPISAAGAGLLIAAIPIRPPLWFS